jgi:hypothetical protein
LADLWKIIKGFFKFIFVVVVAFFEAITVSFYKNIKKWYEKPSDEYRQLKVPSGYHDEKAEPEYKDLSKDGSFSDFGGLPGFKM